MSLLSGKQSSHQTQRNNKKLTSSGFKQQPICTPLAPTRNKTIYKTACSDGPNSGSGKTFSKPASLKRASLVALPVAISHKVSLKPKLCASATLIQKTSKNEPKHGPKNGTAWRSHFWDRMHSLVKRTKEKHFHGPIFGTVRRYQKWDRKIAKSTAKAEPCNKQKIATAFI